MGNVGNKVLSSELKQDWIQFIGKSKEIFFCVNLLYVLAVLPLICDPGQKEISLAGYTTFVWNTRSQFNKLFQAGISGLFVTFIQCKTNLHKKFMPVMGMSCLVFTVIYLALLINSYKSCMNQNNVVEQDIDNFCNKPVQRPPVKDYGQIFMVDGSLTGSEQYAMEYTTMVDKIMCT